MSPVSPGSATSALLRPRPRGDDRRAGRADRLRGRTLAAGATRRGTNVGRGAKTPVSMRVYGRTRDYTRRGSPPSATTSTIAAISFSRSAFVSPEVPEALRPEGLERDRVWLEKHSAMRLIWIRVPHDAPSFPSVVPLADSLLRLSRRPRLASPMPRLKPLFCGPPQARLVGNRRTYGGWFVKGS